MASKDVLDHGVLGPFSSRVALSKSGRAAENIAFSYDSFPKTLVHVDRFARAPEKSLDAWSVEGRCRQRQERDDRANLLGNGDCGWKRSRSRSPSAKPPTSRHADQTCRMKILGLCL